MRTLLFFLFITISMPVMSYTAWKKQVKYNVSSNKSYHNQELHLYENSKVEQLSLTGKSFLSISGASILSDSTASNKSDIHMYTFDTETAGRPVIRNVKIHDHSMLTMESSAIAQGELYIGENARLNITHVDDDSGNSFSLMPEVSGNVHIENLHLAGRAFISPTSVLIDEYDSSDYLKTPGDRLITQIDNLIMQPGSLLSMQEYIPHMQFNQLQIKNLSGTGLFIMSSHLAGGISDKIRVTEKATGHFALMVADSGHNSATPQRIDLVSTPQGNARFELLNHHGIVEIGTWQYSLYHEQNQGKSSWYLAHQPSSELPPVNKAYAEEPAEIPPVQLPSLLPRNESQDEGQDKAIPSPLNTKNTTHISPQPAPSSITGQHRAVPVLSHSARAVINMASTSRHIMAAEMGTLRQRKGDVSHHDGKLTVWARYLKNSQHLTGYPGRSFHNQLQGGQIGVDSSTEFNQGHWILGALVTDSHTSVQSEASRDGNIRSQSGGIYTTWQGKSGLYWDNVLKLNHFNHTVRTQMYNGTITNGRYHQQGRSVASEVGYALNVYQNLTATPYGRVSFFRTSKVDYKLDNGMAVTLPSTSSMDSELGIFIATDISLASQRMRPYLIAALSREFAGDNRVTINNTRFDLPASGTQGKYGLGSTMEITEDVATYAEIRYQKGNKTENPFDTTIGLHVKF